MAQSLRFVVDLGDAYTKAIASGPAKRERARFPSVVARGLLTGGREVNQLLLDDQKPLMRPADFEAGRYPRTRSFRGADAFVDEVRRRPPGAGARFAGELAAIYGSDREMLGHYPTLENIDALVHKAAILLSPADECEAEVAFVVDVGVKAQAVARYVRAGPRTAEVRLRSYRKREPRRMRISIRGRVIDSAPCAARGLPTEIGIEAVGRVLVVDVGYLRTKVALLSSAGCEYQEEVDGLGAVDCVRRILRDGQEQGLVEDEFAVLRALEASSNHILDIAGRRFDVQTVLDTARRSLAEELARLVQRVAVEQYRKSGEICRGVAVIGGGASLVGSDLAARLDASGLGLHAWVTPDPNFLLAEGGLSLGFGS